MSPIEGGVLLIQDSYVNKWGGDWKPSLWGIVRLQNI